MRLDRDPAHSAHGFGQQAASIVLWFGSDDCVIDQINHGEVARKLKIDYLLLSSFRKYVKYVKGKVFPYTLPSAGPRADPGVQAVSLQVT